MNKPRMRNNLDLYKQEAKIGFFQTFFPIYTGTTHMREHFSNLYGTIWIHSIGGYLTVLWQKKNMEHIAEEVFNKESDGSFYELWETWKELDKKLCDAAEKIRDLNISSLTNEELWQEYEKIREKQLSMWATSIFIDALDLGQDQEKIDHIMKQHGFSPEEVHSFLTPTEPSFIVSVENKLSDVHKSIVSPNDFIEEYFWYGTDYATHRELDVNYVTEQSNTAEHTDLEDVERQQKTLLKKYELKENPLRLFQVLSQWRDERKRSSYIGFYGICRLVSEGMRRQKIDTSLINNLLYSEVEKVFTGQIDSDVLEKRSGKDVLIELGKENWFYTEGIEAKEEFERLKSFLPGTDVNEISGTIASPGVARGVVRIVPHFSSESGQLMEEGDILVTSMTRPEFVPLMRKAGAIVTDEGGISCHAAIVSREMKKPCIIGTKIATQVLSDGDVVEVDADNGVVRII